MSKSFILFLLCSFCISAFATEIVQVKPLHRKVLVVHFDDGYVKHHTIGQLRADEYVVGVPLNVAAAILNSSYNLSSVDDNDYGAGFAPDTIYRKTKPTDFTWLCQAWDGNCLNEDPDQASEHWLYLDLPFDMKNGKTYTLSFPGLPEQTPVTFVFNDKNQHSEAVHTNLLGYEASADEKYGYLYHWLGDGGDMQPEQFEAAAFYLVNTQTNLNDFEGQITFRKPADNAEFAYDYQAPPFGNLLGVSSYDCNFSSFNTPGEYKLCVAGVGCSFPFKIESGVHFDALKPVMLGLYQQRSGVATSIPESGQPRPIPHHPTLTPGFEGKLVYSTFRYPDFLNSDAAIEDKPAIDSAVLGPLNIWGWYQDAGDWDSYFSHTDVPAWLLWLEEMGGDKFGDGQFLNPELPNNGYSDMFDEATWLPRFLYRLRQELLLQNYGTGGVGGGRVFGDLWGGDTAEGDLAQGSWQDTARTWVCTGEDPYMTYKYAGMAAHIAYLLEKQSLTDPDNIDWAAEAVAAYTWAEQNTLPTDTAFFVDIPMSHFELFAAANLFRLTGEAVYKQKTETQIAALPATFAFSTELALGLAAYLKAEPEFDLSLETRTTAYTLYSNEADFQLVYNRDKRACRWGGNYFFPLVIGQSTTPLINTGVMGHYLFKDSAPAVAQQWLSAIYSTADYFLGNNPLNMTYISGVGERSPREIFNLDNWYLGGDTARYGIVPYGAWQTVGDGYGIGPWSPYWPFEFAYPAKDNWPAHERWFDQRTCPLGAEYTVYQTLSPSIFTYGYLYALNATPFVSSTKEKVALALALVPNPAMTEVRISFPTPDASPVWVRVVSMQSQTLLEQPLSSDGYSM